MFYPGNFVCFYERTLDRIRYWAVSNLDGVPDHFVANELATPGAIGKSPVGSVQVFRKMLLSEKSS